MIQVDDPTVGVTVTENQIVIHDQPGQAEITLAAGVHQFEVTVKQPSGDTTFNTDRFLLHRGGRKVIDVRLGLEKSLAKRRLASSMLPADESRVVLTKGPGPQAPGSSSWERGGGGMGSCGGWKRDGPCPQPGETRRSPNKTGLARARF